MKTSVVLLKGLKLELQHDFPVREKCVRSLTQYAELGLCLQLTQCTESQRARVIFDYIHTTLQAINVEGLHIFIYGLLFSALIILLATQLECFNIRFGEVSGHVISHHKSCGFDSLLSHRFLFLLQTFFPFYQHHTVQQEQRWVVDVIHEKISLKSSSGIIYSHLLVLIRSKPAQPYVLNDPQCYQ